MKLNKLLAALLSLSMTTMTFASSPVSIYAEDTASADILNIRFLDMRTGDPVEGINARIERRNYTQFYNEYSKYNQYSDVEVIAESVDNEIVVNKSSLKLYDVVVVDELPDGYTFQTNYDGATYIEQPLVDTFDRLPIKKGSNELDFLLEKDQSKYDRYDYDEHIVTTTAPMFAVTTTTTAVTTTSTVEKTTAVTNKSELKYIFRWTTPPIMEYTVGDELDFSQGLILYQGTDENGDVVDYGHVPLFQLKTEHEPFTKPGDYEVKVYRQTNGEIALTYTVHVSEKSDTQPSATEPVSIGNGDANCDGQVTIADAAAILQYLGNNDKYPLSETGHRNADLDGNAGITTNDATANGLN